MILAAKLFLFVVLFECKDGMGGAISIGWVGDRVVIAIFGT